jgi:SAM-dependent methyltransferase
MSNRFYRAFEERYRGSRELIKGRLHAYSPFIDRLAELHPGARAIDLGCGRGEWLELMGEAGFAAFGVDLDEGMLEACRERGLNVETADALTVLRELPDASVALVSAFHLVEHLPFEIAQELIAQARRVLLPAGLLILETPNPENLIVGTNNFYLDPSHLKPIPPMLLDFMVSFAGFARNAVVRLQGESIEAQEERITLVQLLQGVSYDYAVVGQHAGTPDQFAPFDAAFEAEYGVALDVMAQRYDISQARRYEAIEAAMHARPDLDGTLTHVQSTIAALDQHGSATSMAIAEIDRGLVALDQQALRQNESIAALNAGVRHFNGHADQRLLALETRMAQLSEDVARFNALEAANTAFADPSPRLEALETSSNWLKEIALQVDALGAGQAENAALAQRVAELEQFGKHLVVTTLPEQVQHLQSIAEAVKLLQQQVGRRPLPGDDRTSHLRDVEMETQQEQQQAAEMAMRLQLAEKEAAALRLQAEHHQARVIALEQHLAAVFASTSWRITSPMRLFGGGARYLRHAVREGRVRTTLKRGVVAVMMPLRTAGGGWLGTLARRAKQNESLRRVLLPVLARFPRLNAHLANVVRNPYGVHFEQSSGDITHPDWPGLLPAEYLNMSPSSRKVLLDLARAGQNKPPL